MTQSGKKRPKSSSVTGVTGGEVTPKDKTRVLLPSPFAFLHCLSKDRIENIWYKWNIYLKDKITRLTVALETNRATSVEVH